MVVFVLLVFESVGWVLFVELLLGMMFVIGVVLFVMLVIIGVVGGVVLIVSINLLDIVLLLFVGLVVLRVNVWLLFVSGVCGVKFYVLLLFIVVVLMDVGLLLR